MIPSKQIIHKVIRQDQTGDELVPLTTLKTPLTHQSILATPVISVSTTPYDFQSFLTMDNKY